ncbi:MULTISPECIES: SDR family oxidoreductase [unclassified Bradyrhizobium]|uniref:SDR family oxidoreductase n=1 Tax=unclassified Bradyrhizobium TaxID=2631580 RepID=UPI0024788984|nr:MULTISPECIES: SDR family oxidoreductase [unclassified Bradyrhizobium]WGR68402.1 SDR family oxidoreductase [Bradyrhizobium sp. ISRA426]WGR80457.1 SDR family oxidoreductase [Bradyrhizobium sp. ISRA430]WGR83642.1 SDR family oxidoreductase [Bradyrhizobium sp. ISRA432]
MRVFVTGATGWVGSAVVNELISAGHQVTGLARSKEKATALAAAGADPLCATLDDLDALHGAASAADAVVHTAFNHDFSKFPESAAQDQRVIETLGSALEGSGRPLLVTSGLSGLPRGATEADMPNPASPRKSEAAAQALVERGVRTATVRLAPSVHGLGDHGFIPIVIRMAREKGVSAYLGEGLNCWSGVHRADAARVYRLALEKGVTERVYHAVADEGVPFKTIAEVIGRRLGLPVEPRERDHFGWFANMAGAEMSVSSEHTRALLDWRPTGPDLLNDIADPGY